MNLLLILSGVLSATGFAAGFAVHFGSLSPRQAALVFAAVAGIAAGVYVNSQDVNFIAVDCAIVLAAVSIGVFSYISFRYIRKK